MESASRLRLSGLSAAHDRYIAALGVAAESPAAVYALGVTAACVGDAAAAEQAYRKLLAADPRSGAARFGLGLLYLDLGRFPEAVTELRLAGELVPGSHRVLAELGRACSLAADHALAATLLREGLRELPDDARTCHLHQLLGATCRALGRHDEAVAAFQAALRWRPADARLLVNLGHALTAAGRLDEARDAFERALRIEPDLLSALRNLGTLCLKLERYDRAVETLGRAVLIAPDDPATLRKLALARRGVGLAEEAAGERAVGRGDGR